MDTPSTATLREAAAGFLEEVDPSGGAAERRWVWIKIGPIPFAYPNTKGRQRVLQAHDLHHVLAGYGSGIAGEAELAAWELGSGMTDKTGVRLAIRVFGFGLPWHLARIRRAFVRGRHCRNLVGRSFEGDALEQTVGELRAELGLDAPPPEPSDEDRRAFRRRAAQGVAIVWGPLVPIALGLWWWLG